MPRVRLRPRSSGSGPLERELAIYNWSDYIGETTIADFERETGVRVIYDTYESNEDVIAKLQAGATGYDLVVPSGYAVRVLRALDLLLPIDRSASPSIGATSTRASWAPPSIRRTSTPFPGSGAQPASRSGPTCFRTGPTVGACSTMPGTAAR